MSRRRTLAGLWVPLLVLACGGEPSAPAEEEQPVPPPGPHFSVLPISFDSVARIHPLGHNNKILPIGHSYWDTCDAGYLGSTGRPCLQALLPVRAPGSGVVFSVAPGDGHVSVEGPPGLIWTLAHVTPVAGLARGDPVEAGDVVGTTTQLNSFDFGVMNYGVEHPFVRPERYPESYLHAQHPIEQFPTSLRARLESIVLTQGDPVGRLSYDVAGTAAGNWFRDGAPEDERALEVQWVSAQLFLGRLAERNDTRIVVTGHAWPGMPNRLAVADPADGSWDQVTPADGPTAFRLWGLAQNGGPELTFPHGALLIEVRAGGDELMLEWFDTHAAPAGFTAGALLYRR